MSSLLLENKKSTSEALKNKNGAVYTPTNLAKFVAEKLISCFLKESIYKNSRLNIIDPACGEGELLFAALESLENEKKKSARLRAMATYCCGIDIDKKAIEKLKCKLNLRVSPKEFSLFNTNALYPFNLFSHSGWTLVKNQLDLKEGFDLLIANPPWGADTTSYKTKLLNGDFRLHKGQFDTSDLFIELALSIVKPNGYFAFIIPDSLFAMEREMLRELLIFNTEIKFIGRFGEKIFDQVNRACAVVICQKKRPNPLNQIECFRLTPELRRSILTGVMTFKQAVNLLSHKIPQFRFQKNTGYIFDIDAHDEDQKTLTVLKESSRTLKSYLIGHRGVELSKTGRITQCGNCKLWMPSPIKENPRCLHCKKTLKILKNTSIISTKPLPGWKPLIVGKSIRRFQVDSHYWISTYRQGINYKRKSIYESPKIVVRKTGVGLSAALDYNDAYTNQVVYIFRLRQDISTTVPLEFFLGLLCSRASYYYLVKTYGETEWRSHPYVTQKQILELPLPKMDLESGLGSSMAKRVEKLLKPYLVKAKPIPHNVDAEVESIIARLFGISKEDYARIYTTLNNVEELLPIKALKQIPINAIFPG